MLPSFCPIFVALVCGFSTQDPFVSEEQGLQDRIRGTFLSHIEAGE